VKNLLPILSFKSLENRNPKIFQTPTQPTFRQAKTIPFFFENKAFSHYFIGSRFIINLKGGLYEI